MKIDLTLITIRPTDNHIINLVKKAFSSSGCAQDAGNTCITRRVDHFTETISICKKNIQLRHKSLGQQKIKVSDQMRYVLQLWMDRRNSTVRVPVNLPIPDITLTTDASTYGWGVLWNNQMIRGTWSPWEKHQPIRMKAILIALTQFVNQLSNRHVLIVTDNTSVMTYIKKEGDTVSEQLTITSKILALANHHNMVLSMSHIASDLNVLADKLSWPDNTIPSEL